MGIRISEQQKHVLLELHFYELKFGLLAFIETSTLRHRVSLALQSKNIRPNHFLIGLKTLMNNGYIFSECNSSKSRDFLLAPGAKSNELLWRLSNEGRVYAETLHSSMLRPKRSYQKKKH